MCGIVGVVSIDVSAGVARSIVEDMASRVRHRGPDGGGVAVHVDATLGMTRLAIVDIEGGQQPMSNDDETVVIVFNGEIYNAPSLRDELVARGVRFQTRSDTEVILRLYEANPDDVERHLAGMWAFAIHDRRRRRVVISRDRFGIKPLFVADTGKALAFASELRCFDRSLSPFAPLFEIDHAAAHAMLSWSFVPENATIFRGVVRLPPRHRMTIDLESGRRAINAHWQLRPSADAARITSIDEATDRVEAVLRRSVREHLESDVPIATFLSGGIDSSLVTALAVEESSRPIVAYSIGFREPRFDESPYARETAKRIGIEIRVEMFDEASARDHLADALLAYDEPFGDSSSLAVTLLCRRVGTDFKVALGGDGGDEVFAGYKKYKILNVRSHLASFPAVRDGIGRWMARLPTRADRTRGWTELLRTLHRLSAGLVGDDAEVYARLTQVASLARTAPLVAEHTNAERFLEANRARFLSSDGDALQRTLAGDLTNSLPNDMLTKVDRASMASHLEVRVPFLDHRLVELGIGLPRHLTLGGGGKVVLRAMHERRFGRALARRKKTGFGVPVERWLRGALDGACERLFDARRLDQFGVLSSSALSGGRHREWLRREPILVWHAFCLAAWSEAVLGAGPAAVREIVTS